MDIQLVYEGTQNGDGTWMFHLPSAVRLDRFRDIRIAEILAQRTPVQLPPTPKVVVHIVPNSAFGGEEVMDVATLAEILGELRPLDAHGWNHRYNFDGFLTFTPGKEPGSGEAYLQWYRTGIIETVATRLFATNGDRRLIVSLSFEQEILKLVTQYLKLTTKLSLRPAFYVLVTLLDVRGYRMAVDESRYWGSEQPGIDRDHLLLPSLTITDMDTDVACGLKPTFDRIWQATGWGKSHYYDGEGHRLERYR